MHQNKDVLEEKYRSWVIPQLFLKKKYKLQPTIYKIHKSKYSKYSNIFLFSAHFLQHDRSIPNVLFFLRKTSFHPEIFWNSVGSSLCEGVDRTKECEQDNCGIYQSQNTVVNSNLAKWLCSLARIVTSFLTANIWKFCLVLWLRKSPWVTSFWRYLLC